MFKGKPALVQLNMQILLKAWFANGFTAKGTNKVGI